MLFRGRLAVTALSHHPTVVCIPSLHSCTSSSSWRHGTSSCFTLRCARRFFHCTFHEPITPELITIESIDESQTAKPSSSAERPGESPGRTYSTTEDNVVDSNDPPPPRAAQHHAAVPPRPAGTTTSSSSLFTDVTTIDTFAKGKVVNFLRRMGVKDPTIFHVSPESTGDENRTDLYRARAKLTLPPPHGGMFVAEGLGVTEKDAESLAAMHAEFIIDALGIPLFRLSTPQIKHAEAARRAGRYAPLPGDPMKPVGTEVPGTCRMITLGASSTSGRTHEVHGTVGNTLRSHSDGGQLAGSGGLFRHHVMEAEIVNASAQQRPQQGGGQGEGDLLGDSSPSSPNTPTVENAAPRHPYSATAWAPWAVQGDEGPAPRQPSTAAPRSARGNTPPPVGGGGAAATFDPTENGMFQMVNVQSTRMSPSKDALMFAAVFDKLAYDRLKDYFFGHGLDIKKRFHYSHVAVAGYSVRMHVAECLLAEVDAPAGGIIARGKAQDKECAMHLAAMHAELLLDALGRRLFPSDNARQSSHAAAARGFGRWATDPAQPIELQLPPATLRNVPLPLPLKQQVGGDDVWLDPGVMRRQRTFEDRVLVSHNELNLRINELIEVNPPQSLLSEAKAMVQAWQRDVAHNERLPDAFLITKMGDFYRASTLLPVPRELGVRGGTAIGRNIEQAIELASLHALDTLCALGLPVCACPEREREYLRLRESRGLVTPSLLQQTSSPTMNSPPAADPAAPSSSPLHQRNGYLPGYIIEGNNTRMPPHFLDLWAAIGLDTRKDFCCVTDVVAQEPFASIPSLPAPTASTPAASSPTTKTESQLQEERIIEVGNDVRSNLQFYMGRATRRPNGAALEPSVFITGYASSQSVYNIAFMPVPLPSPSPSPREVPTAPSQAKSSGPDASAQPSVALPSGEDAATEKPPNFSLARDAPRSKAEILAVGLSLKKKDAERMCFIHAAQLLLARGIDIRKERELMAFARRQATGGHASTSAAPAAATRVVPTEISSSSESVCTTHATQEPLPLPRPVMHPAFMRQVEVASKEQQKMAQLQQRRLLQKRQHQCH